MADAPESASFLRDYLYIDRVRLALMLAQLLPDGIPESARRSSEEDRTSTRDYGADVKLARFGGKETERVAQSLEQVYRSDTGIPNLLLDLLFDRGFIFDSMHQANPGQIVHVCGRLKILDLGSMRNLWEYTLDLVAPRGRTPKAQRNELGTVMKILEKLPHPVQMSIDTGEGEIWASLNPDFILGGVTTFVLQYGSRALGEWHAIGLMDEIPSGEEWQPPETPAQDIRDTTETLQNIVRRILGRPYWAWGITPLFIYRLSHPNASFSEGPLGQSHFSE